MPGKEGWGTEEEGQEAGAEGGNESLSMSLLERFDQMETEEGEPERRINTVQRSKTLSGSFSNSFNTKV